VTYLIIFFLSSARRLSAFRVLHLSAPLFCGVLEGYGDWEFSLFAGRRLLFSFHPVAFRSFGFSLIDWGDSEGRQKAKELVKDGVVYGLS
jgi:hypothetical protein